MSMIREEIFPFEWEGWDEQDNLVNSYYYVTFFEDFGRIKAGDKFECITVDYARGFIEIYDEKDNFIVRQYFKGVPCESENNIP